MNGVTYFMAVVKLEDDDALKVGMSTEVTLLKEEVKGAVTLPMTAIRFHDDNTPYVLKKGTEGIAVEVDITTGIHDGTRVEIIEGVQVGESILLEETGQTSGFGIGGGLRQELPGGEN
jgi:HlyD family secretion protein